MIEVGVARPMAQGQAMMSTATPATSAWVRPGPKASQTATVTAAMAITTGTKTRGDPVDEALDRQRADCACSTMRMICDSVVSRPTRVARKVSAPVPFTVPPVTSAPGGLLDRDGFAGEHGFVDVGGAFGHDAVHRHTFARARTQDESPATMSSTVDLLRLAVAQDRGGLWLKPDEPRIAAPVRPLARASSVRPSRMSVTMTAAASK
jgi:hypothetical protein